MNNISLVIPHTAQKGLVLNQQELRELGVSGISFNVYALLSHYQSITKLAREVLLPSSGFIFLDAETGFDKRVDETVFFRSTIDGRKLSVSYDELQRLESVASCVFYPSDLADAAKIQPFMRILFRDACHEINTYDSQSEQKLYITDVDDINDWDYLCQKDKIWVESDLALSKASESVAFVNRKLLALDKLCYQQDYQPLSSSCKCYTCSHFTRAYLHHLLKQTPLLAIKLVAIHNLADMICAGSEHLLS